MFLFCFPSPNFSNFRISGSTIVRFAALELISAVSLPPSNAAFPHRSRVRASFVLQSRGTRLLTPFFSLHSTRSSRLFLSPSLTLEFFHHHHNQIDPLRANQPVSPLALPKCFPSIHSAFFHSFSSSSSIQILSPIPSSIHSFVCSPFHSFIGWLVALCASAPSSLLSSLLWMRAGQAVFRGGSGGHERKDGLDRIKLDAAKQYIEWNG